MSDLDHGGRVLVAINLRVRPRFLQSGDVRLARLPIPFFKRALTDNVTKYCSKIQEMDEYSWTFWFATINIQLFL